MDCVYLPDEKKEVSYGTSQTIAVANGEGIYSGKEASYPYGRRLYCGHIIFCGQRISFVIWDDAEEFAGIEQAVKDAKSSWYTARTSIIFDRIRSAIMPKIPIAQLVKEIETDAYQRGQSDARREIRKALGIEE